MDTFWVQLTNTLKAALTPLIALIALYIAWQQYKINNLKMKRETYDRNLKIYRATVAFVYKIVIEPNGVCELTQDELRKFQFDTVECRILNDNKLQDFIEDLYINGNDLVNLNEQVENLRNDPLQVGWLNNREQEVNKLVQWFAEQYNLMESLFAPYLTYFK